MNVNANSVLWTTVDTRNALFASVIPVGLGISHYVSTRPGHHAHNLMKVCLSDKNSLIYQSTFRLLPNLIGPIAHQQCVVLSTC